MVPPHCDTMDGPVVKAAQLALERGNVNLILPYAPKKAEAELRHAFDRTMRVRMLSPEARETVDYWFFETAVRLHREGEGAPFTGLKPAGLDEGPAVRHAEQAIQSHQVEEITHFLCRVVAEEIHNRFHAAMILRHYGENDVDAARAYVQAMLGFVVYSHTLYTTATSSPHEHAERPAVEHPGHHH